MYDRILVATDGSPTARRATAQAVELARQTGAALHAVYVVETRTGYDNAIVDPEVVRRNLEADGREALAAVETEAGSDLAVTAAIREGVPHEELLAYADEHGVDLVVVGAKGRSAFKTRLLGSVTEALLHSGSVPVLVVDGADGEA
ncbi:universal stress protein [Natronomonas marina]|jgi:nucleotide-binding universal stress UspA family protein|uniref:universal stress protein n=1 Tax=Natronomonas marina TaxID=2961939 RepID=UPI0020C9A5EE|nr:universal stress protein [Natronomonas marina]